MGTLKLASWHCGEREAKKQGCTSQEAQLSDNFQGWRDTGSMVAIYAHSVENLEIERLIPWIEQQKSATAHQGCRSNAIGKGFLSPPQWLWSKPRPQERGPASAPFLRAGFQTGVGFTMNPEQLDLF
ncbi:MAG: hypothetical protein LBR88_08140, partial [Zoogloeaceae bacterium]|nr:hypothetical protein [Zoogloeaceae bacterium]